MYTDIVLSRLLQHAFSGRLVEQVKADHDHIPQTIVDGARQGLVLHVFVEHLGDADAANFSRLARFFQARIDVLYEMVVVLWHDAVQIVDVDIVCGELPQTLL